MIAERSEPAPRSEAELHERLSRPGRALSDRLGALDGDLLILGAGGKMGPSLACMAKRANPERRVIAVSRWSNAASADAVVAQGVEVLRADLLNRGDVDALPDAPNVMFMAGQKFGTSANPCTTWAMNAGVPALVASRYAGARIAAFSTGNVYPLTAPTGGGSRETDAPAPVGEYAFSCLARERLFEHACLRNHSLVSIVRLNYAHALTYGVLTDLALRIVRGQPVDLSMGHVNVIWQGDANALALASLLHASSPHPHVVNVAGRDVLAVADLARALARRLGTAPVFAGTESVDALLSNSERSSALLGEPLMTTDMLLDWTAEWVSRGGAVLDRPTHFEARDGRF